MTCQKSHSILAHSLSGLLAWFCSAPPGWGLEEEICVGSDSAEFKFKGHSNDQKEECDQGSTFKYLTWDPLLIGGENEGVQNRTRPRARTSSRLGFLPWPTPFC